MSERREMIRTEAPVNGGRPWASAVVWIVLLLVIGVPVGYVFVMWNHAALNAPARIGGAMTQFAADVLRPQKVVNDVVFTSIRDLHARQKLIVLESSIDADVTREEGDTSWGFYWGTNVARVAVRDARVQYCIDLSSLGTADFVYDHARKTLTVTIPYPRLDTQMVGIDPAKIQTLDLRGGWARLDKQSTRDSAIAELRPRIIIQASTPFMKKQAEEAGKTAMLNLLSPMAQTLGKEGVKLDVVYRGRQ